MNIEEILADYYRTRLNTLRTALLTAIERGEFDAGAEMSLRAILAADTLQDCEEEVRWLAEQSEEGEEV